MGILLASLIISVLGEAARFTAESYKNKKSMDADELQLAVTKALNIAQQKGQDKIDELSRKLLNLDFINKSPTLKSIINNRKKKINNTMKDLRNDIQELSQVELEENMERGKLYDSNFFTVDNQYKNYEEKNKQNEQKIAEIQERIESRI